ncbi:hypothetical protein G3580_04240 [Nitrogeniibacter mangrovi]|uniref:Uncharacterized protein n=1 Tax=Nitrogeniibacter mangrovi TaxID=2016596 RepID=A0A6C1AZY0_9RHOO|nr:hypothetical protein [Nitrogeniibacter mangrovi]QID16916.1 hypothetical protein G3580_04240 [Nitrogeniibacter mangrovi]
MGPPRALTPPPAGALRDRWHDASGGLAYHWRAWRHGRRHWRAFHARVAEWLDGWRPGTGTLVLIGPSAGYALNAHFLHRFATHIALEPDPLARALLRYRFRGIRWHFEREDVFADPTALDRLAARHPDAAFLFCNVVGQVFDAEGLASWQARHAAWFDAHAWASWHDVFSSDRAPHALPSAEERALPASQSAAVARRLWAGQRCRVEDHGSFGWRPGATHALWPLTPRQWHVIGWVSHRPDDPPLSRVAPDPCPGGPE